MIKATLNLYAVLYDKDSSKYKILSENSSNLIPLSCVINDDIDLNRSLSKLFEDHTQMSSEYVRFMHLEPKIENKKLVISYYALVPYNIIPTDCYLIPAEEALYDSQMLRKILNIV